MTQDRTPTFRINLWVNEERDARLREAGLAEAAQEVLAGLKVIALSATPEQKDALLARFPTAKCDTSTTNSIELLPREVKDRLFALVLERRGLNIVGTFLDSVKGSETRSS